MADAYVTVAEPDGTEKKIQNVSGTVSAQIVLAQGVVSVDPTDQTIKQAVGANGAHVDVRASALPTGAATSAAQTTGNASLSSIDGKLPALVSSRVPVDGSGVTQPVSNAGTFAVQSRDAQASANNPGAQVSVTASTTVLASNASRKGAKIYADPLNTAAVYVKLGATATSSNFPLHPGDSIDLNFGGAVYTGVVDAIAASGTQAVNVLEI